MQYGHIVKYRDKSSVIYTGTLAVVPLTKAQLEYVFSTHSNKTMMNIGLAITSPQDEYVKKIGRIIASERIGITVVDFLGVEIAGTKHVYKFSGQYKINNKTYLISFSLTTVADSEVVKLIEPYAGRV